MTTKRVPPGRRLLNCGEQITIRECWYQDCLQDLDAGLHAIDCGCDWGTDLERETGSDAQLNACSEIVRCALKFEGYEVPGVRKSRCDLFANNPPVERVERPKPTPPPPPKDAP